MRRSRVNLSWLATMLILLMEADAFGQAARGVARGVASEAAPLLPIFLQLFGNFGGLAAIVSAGIWARGKGQDVQGLAKLVAAAGGLWSAYAWLGWPFVTSTQFGWLGLTQTQVSDFSFMRLLGMGVFALLGMVGCLFFSAGGQQGE